MFVKDGDHILHAVISSPYATYDKICHLYMYVSYVQHYFRLNTVVIFDGCESSNSTKIVEQQR